MYLTMLFRRKMRLALNVLLLLLATAFFCMSLNLYQNSVANVQQVADTYRTIAIMELYGNVNQKGELVEPGYSYADYAGRRSVAVTGFDFSPALEASGVIDYDLRVKYAAYIEGEIAMERSSSTLLDRDIIRFRLAGDTPVTIPVSWASGDGVEQVSIRTQLEILDSAMGCYQYSGNFDLDRFDFRSSNAREYYEDDIKRLNRSEETESITLYPGVEYAAFIQPGSDWELVRSAAEPTFADTRSCRPLYFTDFPYFATGFAVNYGGVYLDDKAEWVTPRYVPNRPLTLIRWEDIGDDPEYEKLFHEAWENARYSAGAFTVALTNDFSGVPANHIGSTSLSSGRMITQEEYDSGAKVCMVSSQLAIAQGWRVGDKLDMNFFYFEAFANENIDYGIYANQPIYHQNTEGFFDQGEYEIVGVYRVRDLTGNSGISQGTLSQHWGTIYLPKTSVSNTLPESEVPVHGALLTIWLENGSVNAFLSDLEASGFLEEKPGQYTPVFTFYDQGYSVIQPSLQNLYGTSKLLLALSSLLLVITAVLLAWFFAQSHKHNLGILRMLGASKAHAMSVLLLSVLVITLLSSTAGTALGHTMAERLGQDILSTTLAESEKTTYFNAFVLAAEEPGAQTLSVTANATTSAVAACSAWLFPLFVWFFAMGFIHQEPRALLPRSQV